MLLGTYFAQNYASLIGGSLVINFIDLRFVLSRYKFLKIVVPILNKDGVRICSIGTLFLLWRHGVFIYLVLRYGV